MFHRFGAVAPAQPAVIDHFMQAYILIFLRYEHQVFEGIQADKGMGLEIFIVKPGLAAYLKCAGQVESCRKCEKAPACRMASCTSPA